MCVAKKPHIDESNSTKDRNPPILRNPILDGMLGNIAALRGGRNALRIDLLNPLAIPVGGGIGGGFSSGSSGSGGTSSGGSSGGTSTTSGTGGTFSSGGMGGKFTQEKL